jgi:hypothetical protein
LHSSNFISASSPSAIPHEAQTFLSAFDFESAFVLLHLPTANIIAVMTATYDKEKKVTRLLILFNCLSRWDVMIYVDKRRKIE